MSSEELKKRIAGGENLTTEFKVAGIHPDDLAASLVAGADLDDLDFSYFERFLLQAYGKRIDDFLVSRDQLLRNLRLARDGRPTIAGLLLFGREVERFLPHAQVNAAQFSGSEIADSPEDRKDFTGKLADQFEGSMRFLKAHLRVRHDIKGMEPERSPELPEEALREAMVNALVHRDYTVRGPIRLLVFRDRIEVHSPGKPPNTVDVEAMKLGTHVPRNPIILSHLAKMGYVTSLGSGIPRMIKLVAAATGKEPEIAIRGFEVLVSIPRAAPPPPPRSGDRSPGSS